MYQVKPEYLVPVQVNGDLNDNVGSEHGGEALEVNILMIEDTNEFEQVQFEQNYMKGFSQMLLKIQESLHLPVSTVSIIVDEMKTIVHQSMEYTKEKVLSLLDCNNINEELKQKITAEFTSNIFSTSVNKFSTPYRRQQFVERNYQYVRPLTISLGLNAKHRLREYQYIPVLESLRCLLRNDDILSAVLKNQPNSNPYLLTNFSDGCYFKQNALFSTNINALQLILYFDEFEVVNPLGSRRGIHKLGAFYFALGNLNIFQRSALRCIQLCILCPVVDIKEFGIDKIVQPLIYDLEILETDGIKTELGQVMKGTLCYICGDNLGSHKLGGFTESFWLNMHRTCRFCLATTKQSQSCFEPSEFTERNEEMYKAHLEEVKQNKTLSSVYGLKRDSAFNDLQYFCVCRGLPPDCMHDLLEGCARIDIPLILKKMVSDHIFSEDEVMLRLQSWSYKQCDTVDKPTNLKTLSSFNQSAAQTWTLVRFLPIILGDLVPEDNKEWNMLLLLKDITEMVLSPTFDKRLCAYLHSVIVDHHLLLKECFPVQRITHKLHNACHYAELTLKFGPLRSCWCMRFEAKHKYFKQLAIRLSNFKSLSSLLSSRHQTFQAYIAESEMEMTDLNFYVPVCKPLPQDKDISFQNLFHEKGIEIEGYAWVSKVIIQGVTYSTGSFIVTGCNDDGPIFSKIIYIIVKSKNVMFVANEYTSVYEHHIRAYMLSQSDKTALYSIPDLLDASPLNDYKKNGMQYAILKHFICSRSL